MNSPSLAIGYRQTRKGVSDTWRLLLSSTVAEFEAVLKSLGWRAGLILPRHLAESQWLTMNGAQGDSLLLSSSDSGFTAVVFRGKQPLIIRTISCGAEECEDELYRELLLYNTAIVAQATLWSRLNRCFVFWLSARC